MDIANAPGSGTELALPEPRLDPLTGDASGFDRAGRAAYLAVALVVGIVVASVLSALGRGDTVAIALSLVLGALAGRRAGGWARGFVFRYRASRAMDVVEADTFGYTPLAPTIPQGAFIDELVPVGEPEGAAHG